MPRASCNQPGWRAWKRAWRHGDTPARLATPIWSCSRWGLPCRSCCQSRGALLPHPFTLAQRLGEPLSAVCFLWHFPWGRPRRPLAATVFPWSPDFPLPAPCRQKARALAAAVRPAGIVNKGAFNVRVNPSRHSWTRGPVDEIDAERDEGERHQKAPRHRLA